MSVSNPRQPVNVSITGNTAGATALISTGTLSLVGGNNITLSQAANAITISGAGITNFSTVSLTALGNTTSSSAGTFNNLVNFSGAGAISVGVGAGSVTISGPTPVNFSTVSLTVLGNTTNSSTGSFNNLLNFSGAGAISIGAGAGSVTISGPTPVNYSTVSLTALGNTTVSSTGAVTNLINFSGAGIASVGVGAASVTISVPAPAYGTQSLSAGANSVTGTAVSLALVAGNNVSLATATAAGALTVTISNLLASKVSFTQNMRLQDIGGSIANATGTVTGTAGFGSSLFLHRLFVPAAMTLSEVDLAMGMSFPATNQGAGTMSQSVVIYSFGNTSSLASVGSASGTFAWATGTTTAGGNTSLTQYQGGWSVPKIHPLTFGTSSISAGDYVVGNLINFAQGSSTWTIQLLGALASITNSVTLSNVTSVSGVTTNMISAVASLGPLNLYELSSNTFAGSAASAIATATSISTKSFSIQARTLLTASTSTTGVSAVNTSTQSIVPQYLTIPNLVYIGTGAATSALPSVFIAGIMSTGAIPVAITLTSTAVTYFGTPAGAQPYFALIGS